MKELEAIKTGDGVGITAPSDGNSKETDLVRLENGKLNLEERGFFVRETASVRKSIRGRSASGKERAKEFMGLMTDSDIRWIISAKGGDFLLEMLPWLDWEELAKHPKWIQGYSDNTGLLYPITTLCDMPTVYGCNFNDFGMARWHPALVQNVEILSGKRLEQKSFDFYEPEFEERVTGLEEYHLTKPVKLTLLCGKREQESPNKKSNQEREDQEPCDGAGMKGRLLGGCLDVLLNLLGTKYDGTKEFNRRYAKDGVLWYLETFALSAERLTMGLWQMRQAGWFERAAGFLFGRPCFFQSDYDITFEEAVQDALGDLGLPIVTGADIGHRAPQMTMVNGWIAEFTYGQGKGRLRYELEKTLKND